MKRIRSFDFGKYDTANPIIIYGAGRWGQIAYYGLKSKGVIPQYFADNFKVGDIYLGVPVIDPRQIPDIDNAVVIIAAINGFNEIVNNLNRMKITRYFDMTNFALLSYERSALDEYALDELDNFQRYVNVVNSEGFTITHIDLVLTEKCSLKCKDCANLMQYYSCPENINLNYLIESFDQFLKCIDTLLELRLLGGEPFIYPELAKVIEKYGTHEKIKRITIYTNSTIIPNKEVLKVIKKYNVKVHMSDYGMYSRALERLEDIFREEGIEYNIHKYEKWGDLGKPLFKGYDKKTLEEVYISCKERACMTFYRGKFYMCPRAAHGERLGYYKNNTSEVLDCSQGTAELNRNKLMSMLKETEYIEACKYCNGMNNATPEVFAAVQEIKTLQGGNR